VSEQPEDPDDVRGTWTITIEGGPATAANLATAVRSMIPQSWIARTPSMAGFAGQLVTALERAQFTPSSAPVRKLDHPAILDAKEGDLIEVIQPDGERETYRLAKATPTADGSGVSFEMERAEP
jgi:hypothetical protein